MKDADVPYMMAAYKKLCEAIAIYRGGKRDDDTLIYTQIAFKFITGIAFAQAVEKHTASLIADTITIFLAESNMECTCPPDWISEDCFQCNVDRDAKKQINARNNLLKQGVING